MAYVDTNVVIAKYAPRDPLNKDARAFFSYSKTWKVISPISIVELIAVLSRLETELEVPAELESEPWSRRIRAVAEFFIRDCRLLIVSSPITARTKIAGTAFIIPLEYQSSIRQAHALKLKTLELIHLKCAENVKKSGAELNYFVTGDIDVLSHAEVIKDNLGITVTPPNKDL